MPRASAPSPPYPDRRVPTVLASRPRQLRRMDCRRIQAGSSNKTAMVELLGRYSRLRPLPKFTLASCTARRTDLSADSKPQKRHKVAQRLSPQQRATLIEAYVAGASSRRLMEQFGLGKGPVLDILNEAGVVRKPRVMTQAQIAKAAALYGKGWSTITLGEHFGFNPGTVWLKLKQDGVPMRQPWERL